MAHFALVGPDDGGHLMALGSLGQELVRRGHRVTVIAREKAATLAAQFNLEFHPWQADDINWPSDWLNHMAFGLVGMQGLIDGRCWLRWQGDVVLRLLPRLLQELAVDGVLFDHVLSAGGTAAERVGLPFVSVCTALPWLEDQHVPPPFTSWTYATDARTMRRYRLGYAAWRWYVRPMLDRINHERRRWNLPRFSHIDETLSPLAQISQLCADCDYPRRKLPDVFHYIGSLTASREMKVEVSFPWDRLDGRPLIFASLGTVHNNRNLRVFRKILNGCAGLDAQIVLVLGQTDAEEEEPLREQLGAIPDNAIVVDFAPQVPLLQKASLLITHAGVNTVMETANTGLPILALPRNYDQMGMAARIERIGVGRALSFARSTPEQIGQSVRQLLSDESFRRQSATLRKAIVAAGGVRRAADIAEEALLSRRPVRSNSHSHVAPKPHGWTVSARGGLVPR